jgi:hypothetical protein
VDYTQLVDLIQDYTETREASFVANIPRFVRQAEQRVYRSVALPELRKTALTTLTPGWQYLCRPDDFLAVVSLAVVSNGQYSFLYDKDASFIREAYPNPGALGVPKVYAQFSGDAPGSPGDFILGPTPDAPYIAELQYYYDPPSIVDSGTSWLGDNAEPVLLYGALIEAYTYLKGDEDMMKQYTERYNEALSQLFAVDLRSKRDDYRDGQLRSRG